MFPGKIPSRLDMLYKKQSQSSWTRYQGDNYCMSTIPHLKTFLRGITSIHPSYRKKKSLPGNLYRWSTLHRKIYLLDMTDMNVSCPLQF
jgi:hypothetical protein